MVRARKYVVKKTFEGLPKRNDFEIVSYDLPALQDGDILVKTEYISVDPYLRSYLNKQPVPYDQVSFQVGIVQESKSSKFPVGTRVVSHEGWKDYYVANEIGQNYFRNDSIYKMPDLQGLSISHSIGAVGMPGATAYFGLLEICQPKAGETVVITGAAGAVGSLVGQIAKIKGCRVIGFAGSDKKVEWLEKELGFDRAFNYKKVNATAALTEAAPNGVDCFFDNVGGESFSEIVSKMNQYGRVGVCGYISYYNEDASNIPKVTDIQPMILIKELRIESIVVFRWFERWPEAFTALTEWIRSGKLIANELVTEGFENIVDSFVGMLVGENFGKALVKV